METKVQQKKASFIALRFFRHWKILPLEKGPEADILREWKHIRPFKKI